VTTWRPRVKCPGRDARHRSFCQTCGTFFPDGTAASPPSAFPFSHAQIFPIIAAGHKLFPTTRRSSSPHPKQALPPRCKKPISKAMLFSALAHTFSSIIRIVNIGVVHRVMDNFHKIIPCSSWGPHTIKLFRCAGNVLFHRRIFDTSTSMSGTLRPSHFAPMPIFGDTSKRLSPWKH